MKNVELLHNLIKRMDALDVFGRVYEELSTTRAPEYAAALAQGDEEIFLKQIISTSKRGYSSSQSFSKVLSDPTGEGLRLHSTSVYAMGNPTALLMLPKIQQAATSRANETMKEYLSWLERNYLGESDAAIATCTKRSVATIRGGRKRAIDFLIEVAHDLRHGGTTYDGELPSVLKKAAAQFMDERLDDAWDTLQGCRHLLGSDPRWLNIAGLVLISKEDYDAAVQMFKSGLSLADDVTMRAKLLNNWGKALHNMEQLEEAQAVYLRAWRLAPSGAPPLLNLLAVASERSDLQDCRYYANQLTKLLGQGKLPESQKETVMNRLLNNPMYDWVRRTDAWKGPSRWLRKFSAMTVAAMVLITGAFALTMLSASPAQAQASPSSAAPTLHTLEIEPQTATTDKTATPKVDTSRTQKSAVAEKGEGWIRPGTSSICNKGEGWIKTLN